MTRPNVNQYTLEELETMEIRELYALTEHWAKAFGDHTFNDDEIAKVRKATGIYIIRRERLRTAAPDLLAFVQDFQTYAKRQKDPSWELIGLNQLAAKLIAKAKGGK